MRAGESPAARHLSALLDEGAVALAVPVPHRDPRRRLRTQPHAAPPHALAIAAEQEGELWSHDGDFARMARVGLVRLHAA